MAMLSGGIEEMAETATRDSTGLPGRIVPNSTMLGAAEIGA
jgi:hypothetical protein